MSTLAENSQNSNWFFFSPKQEFCWNANLQNLKLWMVASTFLCLLEQSECSLFAQKYLCYAKQASALWNFHVMKSHSKIFFSRAHLHFAPWVRCKHMLRECVSSMKNTLELRHQRKCFQRNFSSVKNGEYAFSECGAVNKAPDKRPTSARLCAQI